MKNVIHLGIIDDSEELVSLLARRIQETDAITLAWTAPNIEEGLANVQAHAVDAVLVDLVMPGRDGLCFLEELARLTDPKPACIMASGMGAPHIIARAADLGADLFVLKPFDIDLLFRRIGEICRYKTGAVYTTRPSPSRAHSQPSTSRRIDEFIQGILDNLPLSPALMGYRYIKTAVRLVIENPAMLDGITKTLYPEVARKHKSSASRVERAIRHAIQTIWQQGGAARFAELLGCPEIKKPTNSHFIAAIADRYRFAHPEDADNV